MGAQSLWALNIYRTGNSKDVSPKTVQTFCLAGGGEDDAWASGWKRLLKDSGGGDIVIIRADGRRGEYESWIFNDEQKHGFPKVNSVSTISLGQKADANNPEVEKMIRQAEMVFFAGGDQTDYLEWFKGSKLEKAVEEVMRKKKVPLAGTSAGMAILAGVDFKAKHSSPSKKDGMVTARDVLKDPTGAFVDLESAVFTPPFMKDVITDTHFSERNRQGRLFGFMARASHDNPAQLPVTKVKGIGADEGTAVCFDGKGEGQVYGSGNVFFLKGNAPIERIESGKPLHWEANQKAVQAYVIRGTDPGAKFDLRTWTGSGGRPQFWSVHGGPGGDPVLKISETSTGQGAGGLPVKSSGVK